MWIFFVKPRLKADEEERLAEKSGE